MAASRRPRPEPLDAPHVRRLRPHPLATALALLLAGAAGSGAAQAQTPPAVQAPVLEWQLPAGPLDETLARIGRQSGRSIIATPSLLSGLQAPAIQGAFSVEQAALRALAGSGLQLTQTAGGTLTVLRTGANAPASTGTPAPSSARTGADVATLAPVTVQAQAQRSASTEGSNSYATRDVSMGKGQALREIPQSVSVITRQQMEDQNMLTLDNVMAFMPGVTTGGLGLGGRGNSYYTRGLSANKVQFDGVAGSGLMSSGINLEGSNLASMAIYDHVEVLRGADGLYGGLGDSSGTINLVRKRPLHERQIKLNASVGSWRTTQTELDLNAPLAFDGKLRGRMVLARKDGRYFTEHANSRGDLVYAVGELDLGERTLLTVGGHYNHERGTPQGGELTRNSDGSDPGFARRTSLVAPWSTFMKENTAAFAELRHDFNDRWQANASVNYSQARNSRYYAAVGQAADNANMRLRGGGYPGETRAWDLNLKGRGQLLGHDYDLLLGADGSQNDMDYEFRWNFTYAGRAYNREAVALPQFLNWALYPQPLGFARDSLGHLYEKQQGVYGRAKLEVFDGLNLILGGRYADYEYRYTNTNYSTAGLPTGSSVSRYAENGIFTPYGGLVYDINPRWNAYASVSKVFRSQASAMQGPPPGDTPVAPLQGRNYEVGVKGELADGRATAALALYRLERTGQSTRDTRYPYNASGTGLACCFINKGEVVSQGLDVEIQGEVAPRLQLSASYVYNSIRDKTSGSIDYNTTVAPKHLLKLWSRYQLPGDWSRLTLGGGVTVQSKTYAKGTGFYYEQGGYALTSLFAQYQIHRQWQLGLNINNVFDRKYYASIVDPTYGNYYGEPRNWTVSLRGSF